MSSDPLLQPYRLKHLTLRNRLMTTAHEPAYAEDGLPKELYRAYHVERARAGLALTMTAGSAAVSRDSPPVFNNVLAYKDEVVPWLRELADACHEHGAAVMIQLTHLGRRTRWDKGDWLPAVSASHSREAAHRAFPKKIEDWDIERIVRDFGDAAERMKAAGLDGIELEAYGHLLDQFYSPLTNTLDAPYGGSLDSRLRFTFDVLSEIRSRVGPDFILGIRYTADEALSGGLTEDDGLEVSRRLKESGLVDFLNVVRGHIDTDAGLTDVIPIQGMPASPHLDFAGRIRAATQFPTFHAARIPDVATARHAIASGKLDMVGMTRAHMTDPHIVRKIVEEREGDIRPCVGANYCLDRIYQGGAAYCIHNAATGRETTMPHDIPRAGTPRRIVIVGAGPAGLEAARVAGERGHDVVVLEAANHPGGQVRLTAQSPRRREMMGIIDWRMAQCESRGVRMCFKHLGGGRHGAGRESRCGDRGHGRLSPNRSSCLRKRPGRLRLGHHLRGCEAGLQRPALRRRGRSRRASGRRGHRRDGGKGGSDDPDRSFAPEVMGMNLVPYMRSLQQRDVTFTVTFRLKGVRRDGNELVASIGSDYGGVLKERRVDQVVVNRGTIPADDLYFELKPLSRNLGAVDYADLLAGRPQAGASNPDGTFQLFRIGDAVSARNTHAAIYDALRLVKDI
jgi:2,4-dienoyl-CoA reductase-like NADH-dependent reductase (Old Yellow Enzyme family)